MEIRRIIADDAMFSVIELPPNLGGGVEVRASLPIHCVRRVDRAFILSPKFDAIAQVKAQLKHDMMTMLYGEVSSLARTAKETAYSCQGNPGMLPELITILRKLENFTSIEPPSPTENPRNDRA
jgi:hypothetical protein